MIPTIAIIYLVGRIVEPIGSQTVLDTMWHGMLWVSIAMSVIVTVILTVIIVIG